MKCTVVHARSAALAIIVLLGPSPAVGVRGADGSCDAVVVDETMLPVSGYIVSHACLERYGPWNEADLDACGGGLLWTTLDRMEFDEEKEYVLLACDGSSRFLVHRIRHKDEVISWGRVKMLFR